MRFSLRAAMMLFLLVLTVAFSAVSPAQPNAPGKTSNRTAIPTFSAVDAMRSRVLGANVAGPTAFVMCGDSVVGKFTLDSDEQVNLIVEFSSSPIARLEGLRKGIERTVLQSASDAVNAEHLQFRSDLALIESNPPSLKGRSVKATHSLVRFEYATALNGTAITTSRWVADEIRKLSYVRRVSEDKSVHADDDGSNAAIEAPAFWGAYSTHGEGIDIGIIDTGIDYFHEALGGSRFPNAKVVGGYDFVNDDPDPMDDHGHGTHVAGIAAGDGPAPANLKGVAYHARLWAFKALNAQGIGSFSQVIAAIDRALDPDGNPATPTPIKVISLSLGGAGDPDDAVSRAIDNAESAGMVCAVAAGNSGPAYGTIASPGCARGALTVGASYNTPGITSFSSRGWAQLTFAIKPDVVAPGSQITSAKLGGGYIAYSGTSMATPHVAGAAALLIQMHPSWTPGEIKAALMESARDMGANIWMQGSGRIDMMAASRRSAVIVPPSVNLGLDDNTQPLWSILDTLSIVNHDTVPLTFDLTIRDSRPAGISMDLSPNVVTVSPNSSANVTVACSVDNTVYGFPATDPRGYDNHIIAVSRTSPDTLTLPVGFAHVPVLKMKFDESPWIVFITSAGHGNFFEFGFPGDSLITSLPADTYNVEVEYADLFHTVMREGIVMDKSASLDIHKSDARYAVALHTYGLDGSETIFNDHLFERTLVRKGTTPNTGYYLMISGWIPYTNVHYISSVTGNFTYFAKVSTVLGGTTYCAIPFVIGNGISSSQSLQNDPAKWKRVNYHYYAPPDIGRLYVIHDLNVEFGVDPPFNATGYFAPTTTPELVPDALFPYCYDQQIVSSGPDPLFSCDPILYITGCFINADPDTGKFFLLNDRSFPAFSATTNPLNVELGTGLPQWVGRTWNVGGSVYCGANTLYSEGLFATPFGDIDSNRVDYLYSGSSGLIGSGQLLNKQCVMECRCPAHDLPAMAWSPPGRYELVTTTDDYTIEGVRGKETARMNFKVDMYDQVDENPPHLKSFQVLSGGLPASRFSPDSIADVKFTLSDFFAEPNAASQPSQLHAAALAFKPLNDGAWTALSLVSEESTYTAHIPLSNLPGGFYSLKLTADDTSGNTLDLRMEPAFVVAGPRFSATSVAYGDVDVACAETNTLSIANGDPVNPIAVDSVTCDDSEFTVSPASASILPNTTQTFIVTFHPSSAGLKSGHLVFSHSGKNQPDTISVSGNGIGNGAGSQLADVRLATDWQMISFPLAGCRYNARDLFAYDGNYVKCDSPRVGAGYWKKLETPDFIWAGYPVSTETIAVKSKWNIVGSLSDPVVAADVIQEPPANLLSPYFGFAGGYFAADSLMPGHAYWVRVQQDGKLILGHGAQAANRKASVAAIPGSADVLTFTDARGRSGKLYLLPGEGGNSLREYFTLPPKPPEGGFDVRFGHDRMAEVLPGGDSAVYRVEFSGVAYPVALQFDGYGSDGIVLVMDNREVVLSSGGTVSIPAAQEKFSVKVLGNGARVPSAFALRQSYPNPFNPTTTIRYELPANSKVNLTICNLLGQKVATVVDEVEEAGYRQVRWDASGFGSGIYFYRLEATSIGNPARTFSETKKMVLIK